MNRVSWGDFWHDHLQWAGGGTQCPRGEQDIKEDDEEQKKNYRMIILVQKALPTDKPRGEISVCETMLQAFPLTI